ncbi:OmpA family protein [Qipengyuania spongiae]|uniref:OmpA family protein n=1 Tax=Qipengyuania spongiae TaxID=2909673 RepID=A0ABY5T5P3_9SPHN|nr:OmpA family protein [Qipengyuania spongiae]UVI40656.1 OmpA family protein [Qipengyuania spongiae]
MHIRSFLAILSGAVLVAGIGYIGSESYANEFAAEKSKLAAAAIADAGGKGVEARFVNSAGAVVRHPTLAGGEGLDEGTRANVAQAVSELPGVGGVFWSDGSAVAQSDAPTYTPMHCQEEVEGLLRTRTIRFEEGSAALTRGSRILIGEVAEALRPCLGSIIAVTGHTDESGTEATNLLLSRERAIAVREALVARGIPRTGLRAEGVGSADPVEGLGPTDPANRRIEFSVIRTEPVTPTPIDTPGAR